MAFQQLRRDEEEGNPQEQNDDGIFRWTINLMDESDDRGDCSTSSDVSSGNTSISVPQEMIDSFQRDGFAVFPEVISTNAVDALNDRLEDVLRGVYDRGRTPDKVPRLVKGHKPQPLREPEIPIPDTNDSPPPPPPDKTKQKHNKTTAKKKKHGRTKRTIGPIGFSGNLQNVRVLQIINMHKADSLFRKLETNPALANVVSQLAGWDHFGGARLAQDQFWGKPPNAPPLVFHRDSPYFMFRPSEVVTVWIALDDMDHDLGPLEYVVGSHKWGDGRIGSANQFFQADTKSLLWSAAEKEGIDPDTLDFVSMGGRLQSGGLSIHHGKIWHGSAKNSSATKPRRGLGLHFVPASVRFTAEASKSRLWKPYVEGVEDPSQVELCEEDFPLSI